jgi:putative sigma-54 modulation protein
MNIITSARRIPLTRTLQTFVHNRLRALLEEFAHAIASIRVELYDRNGRRGGGDKRCRIRVALLAAAPVLVEEEQADIRRAVRQAASRAAARVHAALRP